MDDGELSGNFLHSFQSENVSLLASSSSHWTVIVLDEARGTVLLTHTAKLQSQHIKYDYSSSAEG